MSEISGADRVRLLAEISEYATARYDQGWDIIVETYDDKEIMQAIGDATTAEQAIERLALIVEVHNEARAESFAFSDEYYA